MLLFRLLLLLFVFFLSPPATAKSACEASLCGPQVEFCACHIPDAKLPPRCWASAEDCEVDAACCQVGGECGQQGPDACSQKTAAARRMRDSAATDVVLPVVTTPPAPEPVELVPEVDANGFRTGDPTDALDLLEKAVTTRNFFFGAAAILMLVVVVIKRKWSAIPPDMIPAVTLVLTAIPGLILVLMRPGVNAAMVMKQVFVIGLMTSGSWEMIGKRLFETWIPKIKLAMAPTPPPVAVVVPPAAAQGAPAGSPVVVPAATEPPKV